MTYGAEANERRFADRAHAARAGAAAAWPAARSRRAAADARRDEEASSPLSPANIASLTDVVTHNPNDAQAYNMRGAVLGQAGKHTDALTDFNQAISLDPNYAQAYANRGLVYRQTGKLDLALADYDKALALDSELRRRLSRPRPGRIAQKGEVVPALQRLQQGDRDPARHAQGYYNRGLLYQGQHQHQFAIDDFSTAIALPRSRPNR